MGNTNTELDIRLKKVERLLENYNSSIEPKSGEFVGQHWYNESTEVLNIWNGREFTPAYGKSIIKDLEGFETRIEQNEKAIELDVVKNDEIVSKINLSEEGITIDGDKIKLNGDVEVEGTFTIGKIADSLKNTDFQSVAAPENGVIFDGNGITGYKGSEKTFEIDSDGNAYFKGNIEAKDGYLENLNIQGKLVMNSDVGTIQSNFYDGDKGWIINEDGIYFGIDKHITMKPGATIELGVYGSGPKTMLSSGLIQLYYSSTSTVANIMSDYYGTLLLNKVDIDESLLLSSSGDLILSSTYNRIKSGTDGEIYFNGEYWRIKDIDGRRTL